MDLDSASIGMLAALAVLVVFSAYFSATETAFTSLNHIRLKTRADSGSRRAQKTLELAEDGAVTGFAAGEITFTCDTPVAWTVDGEFGGEQEVTVIHNHTQALTMACGGAREA